VFLAGVTIHADAAHACATPSGWNLVGSVTVGDLAGFVFRKVATGSESGSQAFNWGGTDGALARKIHEELAGADQAVDMG
jgi:hypothetical protein